VKSWLTYPRAGYASPPGDTAPDQDPIVGLFGTGKPSPILSLRIQPPQKTNVSNFKNRIFITMGIVGFLSPLCRERWAIALIMLVIALLLLLLTRKDAYAYSWVSVLPVVVAGILVVILDIPTNIRPVTPMLILTGWLVIRGIWLLVRFLRTHPSSGEFEGGRL